jgi:RNA polymerase sigma-70 factor (ECF subfamily)
MSSTLAREDTQGAFERLYQRHRGDVYRFVLRDVRNPADAEDVTQTAFLNAYRALQHGDHPEKPRAWLLTIAQNVARRRFRARSARPPEVELDPEMLVAPEPEGPTTSEIREALSRLRPNHRAVIVLREIAGLSYAEIAETMDLSVSAVETLIFRARRALREELTAGEDRHALRVGGFVIPLPLALSKGLGSLAGWLGRRAVTVQVASAVGAAVVGVGVGVQTGAFARNDPTTAVPPETGSPLALARAAAPDARSPSSRHGRKRDRPAGPSASGPGIRAGGGGGASVLGVELPATPTVEPPAVSVPELPLPDVQLPAQPDLELPPPPDLQLPSTPDPELPALPDLAVPDVQAADLPAAGDVLP